MRILIADDDAVSLLALQAMLRKRGHEVVTAADGAEAWQALQQPDAPRFAILDWMMPGLDGVEVCRRARAEPRLGNLYLILLTSRDGKAHVIEGLKAGANDYVSKPYNRDELEARVNVALQMLRLQDEVRARVRELEEALTNVKQLQKLLPICSYCKSVRDDQNYWVEVDRYLQTHSETTLSHGICPRCWDSRVKPELARQGLAVADLHPIPQAAG